MGTKNNPDEFDCYSKALPDEPTFTLLARDRHMPSAVNDWADNRELEIRRGYGGDKEKLAAELRQLQRAREIAAEAANWRRQNMGVWKGAIANKLSAEAETLPLAIRNKGDIIQVESASIPDTPHMLTLSETTEERNRGVAATADMNDATAEFQLSPPREENFVGGVI